VNRSKTYIAIAAAFAALAALAHFTAKPLLAQVKAALIQNVDEPGRNPFSEEFDLSPTLPGCTLDYCDLPGTLVVPAGKRLVITNITGQAVTSNGLGANVELITRPSGATLWLPATIAFQGGSTYVINLNLQLQSYYEAGQKIELFLSTSGTFVDVGTSVTVSGYYVNL
jgi:hypothetical protein